MSKLIDSNNVWKLIDKAISKIQNNNYVAEQKWFDELWKDFVDLPDKSKDINKNNEFLNEDLIKEHDVKENEKILFDLINIIKNDDIFLFVTGYNKNAYKIDCNYLKDKINNIEDFRKILDDIFFEAKERTVYFNLEYKNKKYSVVWLNSRGYTLLKEDIENLKNIINFDKICIKENMIASYEYEYNDGDQIWSDTTEFYKDKDTNTFVKKYQEGYTGEVSYCNVLLNEIIKDVNKIKDSFKVGSVNKRGGYSLYKDIPKEYYNDYEKDEKNINVDKDENDFDYE